MPHYKVTMIFQTTTDPDGPQSKRTGGWSESFYSQNDFQIFQNNLAEKRAALLSPQASIVGIKFQQVEPRVGRGRSRAVNYPGTGPRTDQPQAALLYSVSDQATGNAARRTLRGFPDSWIVGGELSVDPSFISRWTNFKTRITTDNWRFRGEDLTQETVQIIGASQTVIDGLRNTTFQTMDAHGLATGDRVTISRLVSSLNTKIPTAVYRVIEPVTTFQFTVILETVIPTDSKALMRKKLVIFPLMGTVDYSRVIMKKVGRAPFQFVGRQGGNQR